ncbi:unnamed protein product [Menidia menidia]|uniref:(Atlantic silverside) hypothetical protein n=1 Tax=Menidia menidia TaxID=238744 RepID=A0A8S4B789_9TELE|nr:unnamed protein product [Menidia menidia]
MAEQRPVLPAPLCALQDYLGDRRMSRRSRHQLNRSLTDGNREDARKFYRKEETTLRKAHTALLPERSQRDGVIPTEQGFFRYVWQLCPDLFVRRQKSSCRQVPAHLLLPSHYPLNQQLQETSATATYLCLL